MTCYKKNGEPTKTYIDFMNEKYRDYMKSNMRSIFDAYERPSQTKFNIFQDIKTKAESDVYILSANCHFFTCAYFNYEGNFGEDEIFIVETPHNTYKIHSKYLE